MVTLTQALRQLISALLHRKKVNNGYRTDAHTRERGFALTKLIDSIGSEAEDVYVEGSEIEGGAFAVEGDVVEVSSEGHFRRWAGTRGEMLS